MVKPWQLEDEAELIQPGELDPYIGKEIDLLYELPYLEDGNDAAVYFVFWHCELIYVGSSKQIGSRLSYWARDRRYGRKQYTHIGVLPVPEWMRFTIEAHYIKRFWPMLNKECA